MAEMLKNHEARIVSIVAVSGSRILSPCGRCRETIAQLDRANLDCKVVITEDEQVSLRELLPHHWLD